MIGPRRYQASAVAAIAPRALALSLAALMSFAAPCALAQSNQCELTPDERNPTEKVLRCGATLVVHAAPGTSYRAEQAPRSLQLDDGALMIEFRPSHGQRTFQILTPHAMVAVRGTKWAVEVAPQRSSAFVIDGKVSVSRLVAPGGVTLRPGEGADVDRDSSSPLVVKRWAEKRVRALLARFGE